MGGYAGRVPERGAGRGGESGAEWRGNEDLTGGDGSGGVGGGRGDFRVGDVIAIACRGWGGGEKGGLASLLLWGRAGLGSCGHLEYINTCFLVSTSI